MNPLTTLWRADGDHVILQDYTAQRILTLPHEGPYALPYAERRALAVYIVNLHNQNLQVLA